jgi:dTDP-4-dehydrorhamnose reductase
MRYLILGDGMLGSYLSSKNKWDSISRKKNGIDFINPDSYADHIDNYDVIINCIANTDTYSGDSKKHWNINYKGVADLADLCNAKGKKLVHISTDHVYSNSKEDASEEDVPVHCANWYGYSKLLGEGYVILKSKTYLVIRCSHKKSPFTYNKAYVNQIGNFDYVNVIGDLITELIIRNTKGIFNVGTEKKSMYDLAKKTNPGVEQTEDLYHQTTPGNVTMKIEKLNKFLKNGNI